MSDRLRPRYGDCGCQCHSMPSMSHFTACCYPQPLPPVVFDPDWTVYPGETLREWCDENGMAYGALASRLGVTAKHVSEIMHGASGYSVAFAVKLGTVTGVPARFWWALQCNWELDKALGKPSVGAGGVS